MKMLRNHEVNKNTLEKYPKGTVWVDVWHLAYPDRFTVSIHQSEKHYREYFCRNLRLVGFEVRYSFESLLAYCQQMVKQLDLTPADFNFYGSNLGDTEFLRNKIVEFQPSLSVKVKP